LKNRPKIKNPLSLAMGGVLDALKHFFLLYIREGGHSNSNIFYITIFLYKNTFMYVKKKRRNLNKKQMVMLIKNYFL